MVTDIRLVYKNTDGEYVFESFAKGREPEYAILSHTWGPEEVLYDNILDRTEQSKAGRRKLEFCAGQCHTDGLRYFWIDTCCIDKRNSTELNAAINSMWRWYKSATKCYVYLTDVASDGKEWHKAFLDSRWFMRGWTLQELIAPKVVEFYSVQGSFLSDKVTFKERLSERTGIPIAALTNGPDAFGAEERMSWAKSRTTTIEEDMAYCLLGIVGVSMLVNYGEGKDRAERRLRDAVKNEKSLTPDVQIYPAPANLANVPAARQFVDRPEMKSMECALLPQYQPPDSSHRRRRKVYVLRGLGGIGKTQLAREYASRHRNQYSAVLWIDGSSEDALKQSIAASAVNITASGLSEKSRNFATGEAVSADAVIAETLAWLAQPDNANWLMVFDNVDREYSPNGSDPQAYDLKAYLPRAEHGALLITTRLTQLDRLGTSQEVRKVDKRTAFVILQSWHNIDKAADGVDELLELLDGLPLAIAQAGAFLEQSGVGIRKYLQFYRQNWDRLHDAHDANGALDHEYPNRTISTTWAISFKALQIKSQNAANLLLFWSCINNKGLWHGLFIEFKKGAGSALFRDVQLFLGDLVHDELAFIQAMRLLRSYSLVEPFEGEDYYDIHAVVHQWAYHQQSPEMRAKSTDMALAVLGWSVPIARERNYASLQRRLLPHTEALDQIVRDWSRTIDTTMTRWRVVQDGRLNILQDLLQAVRCLGVLFQDQGKLNKAEELYTSALKGQERLLGVSDGDTLETVVSLGLLYADQGRPVEAEKMYRRALAGRQETLGGKDPLTLKTLNNLGILCNDQGRYEEAEEIYKQALRGKEETLGPKNPSTLSTVYNLGLLYSRQRETADAERMYERALEGYEEALGADHPRTIDIVQSMGILYQRKGKLNEAVGLYTRAMQGYEAALGENHPSTLVSVDNLATLYQEQGRLEEAETLHLRALQGFTNAVGSSQLVRYPPALITKEWMGDLRKTQGRDVQAREFYEEVLLGCSVVYGLASERCQRVQAKISSLATSTEDRLLLSTNTNKAQPIVEPSGYAGPGFELGAQPGPMYELSGQAASGYEQDWRPDGRGALGVEAPMADERRRDGTLVDEALVRRRSNIFGGLHRKVRSIFR